MTIGIDKARRAAELLVRESYGRLVAILAARTRDLAAAEDALAEAFAAAVRKWPAEGVPDNPAAWLISVARRRHTDTYRRRRTAVGLEEAFAELRDGVDEGMAVVEEIPDRRLALMFVCAHPAIERNARSGLILQTVLGLAAADIGPAFLVSPATMGQRLVRAKARIKAMGIPFRVPESEELPDRLDAVLEAVYTAYTKGWIEDAGATTPTLVEEAIYLGHLIVSSLPEEPEAKGMLALMLYSEARRAARRDAEGAFVPLENQTTALWDLERIDVAESLLDSANSGGPSGRYQIEAAIQSAHVARRIVGVSNWPDVIALYDLLYRLTPSPIVALNRAVARANIDGTTAALNDIQHLQGDSRLTGYQPYWAALGHLYASSNRHAEARESFTLAIGMSTDPTIRVYLQRRLLSVSSS